MTLIDWAIANTTDLLISLAIIVISVAVAKLFAMLIRRRMHGNYSESLTKMAEKFVYYLVVLIGLTAAIGNLGVNLTSVLVAGGFLGIVLGLAAQSSVSNLIAGLLLIVDRPFNIGDSVVYGTDNATVVDIGLMSTKVSTWEGVQMRIPNNSLFTSSLYNYTKSVARMMRVQFYLRDGEELGKVVSAINSRLAERWYVLVEPAPQTFALSFSDYGVTVEARAWTAGTTWNELYFTMPQIVNETLKGMGVEFAYPKRTLVDERAGRNRKARG
jgi:2,3-bisphosphoglycerate-dependent phosphoglycerate mutase